MAQHEQGGRERGYRGPLTAFTLASILVWAGAVLLLDKLNLLKALNLKWATWAIIVAGIGIIFLIQALVRLLTPSQGGRALVGLILGVVFLAIGVSNALKPEIILPVVLIVAGLAIFFSRLFRR